MGDDYVRVLLTPSWVEGEIAKGRLESEGIPVDLKGEGRDGPYPVGQAEVFVPSRFEAQARRILEQIDSGSDEAQAEGRSCTAGGSADHADALLVDRPDALWELLELERIAVDDRDVRELSGLERPEVVTNSQRSAALEVAGRAPLLA